MLKFLMNVDFLIIISYMIFITLIGLKFSSKKNIKDYFLANNNISWVLVCFSIVATETSTLTFLSIPGVAYIKGISFLQITIGFFLGRILVAYILLPGFFQGGFKTAYEMIESRFGKLPKIIMSVIFHITRLLADSVRLFSTAIPLALLTGWSYTASIIVIAIITFIYTFYGGLKSVITVDSIQLLLYMACAFIGVSIILLNSDLSISSIISSIPDKQMTIFSSGLGEGIGGIFKGYNIISGVIGGALFSFASHGTDHLIVQRLLSCKDLKSGKKAIILSGVLVIFQFAIFLLLGLLIYTYYGGKTFSRPDEVMPYFIIKSLPLGVKGIMLAGIFAAAMSTLSSSINSLSASTVYDLINLKGDKISEKIKLNLGRGVSFLWTIILVCISLAFIYMDRNSPLVEIGLGIASITYGAMLGAFLLARSNLKLSSSSIVSGIVIGIVAVLAGKEFLKIFWPWYVIMGAIVTMVVSISISAIFSNMLKSRG